MTTPRWSSRPYGEDDRDGVLALFTEPDFFYRTAEPDTRPEWEVLELLGDDTRVLRADGALTGLYALEPVGSDHGCHWLLHLRLRAAAPDGWWRQAVAEVVAGLRWDREVVRLAVEVPEFDARGLELARDLGFTEEGVLAGVTVHAGRRAGRVFFSRIWEPTT